MARKQYFTVRLNKISIKDNMEWGTAEVKVLSFITAGNINLPVLDAYIKTNSDEEKKSIIKTAANDMIGVRELTEVHNVCDDSELKFGSEDAGISVYTGDKIPVDINWSLVLIERDVEVREVGNRLEDIVGSKEFDSFSTNLITLIGKAASPEIAIAFKIGKFIAGTAGKILANNKDDQIGLFATSLNRFQHYPNGVRSKDDVPGVNGNIFIDYHIFGTAYDE
jgi:hypothetical protein